MDLKPRTKSKCDGAAQLPLTRVSQVLMATNRIDILDPALLRPGRIDRKIEFPNPNETSRFDILKIHSRRMNLTRGIDLMKIANAMSGTIFYDLASFRI